MSDDLSKHFRAGAKPIEIDMLKKKVKIPDSPKAYVSYVDIVRLFRLQRKLSDDIRCYETDLVLNQNRKEDLPSVWDDFDPISVAATLGDIFVVLEQVKEKLLYWESYEALSYENNLQRYPELDRAGIQIDFRALIQLQKPSVGIEAEEQQPKRFVRLFGHVAHEIVSAPESLDWDISSEIAFFVTTENVVDLVLCKRHFESILQDYEAYKHDESIGLSDLVEDADDYDSIALGWREDLDSINTILFQYAQLGVDVMAIAKSFDAGDFPLDKRNQQEQNQLAIVIPRYR